MSKNVTINKAELADRLDNDFELFIELTELFYDDSATLLKKIESAISSGDSEALRKSAHTLKGAVSNFSAPLAYDAAFALEQAGREKILTDAENLFTELRSEISNVIEEMRAITASGSFE